jgi:hypothetical protein
MAADTAALRERIVKVKHSRLALITLWHEAVAAAEDATDRRSLSQRRAVDLEAKKFRTLHACRRSLTRHRTGEPYMPSCLGTLLICVIRPSWLPFAPCIQILNYRPCVRRWRTSHRHRRSL